MGKKQKIHKSTQVEHHQHLKKRQYGKNFKRTFVDRMVYVAGPMIPIAIIPQAYSVWFQGKAEGAIIHTWAILSVASLSMATYAIVHREKPLIMTYIPLFLLELSVVIGILVKT